MKNDGVVKVIIAVVIGFVILKSCSNSRKTKQYNQSVTTTEKWQKSPVDELIKDNSDLANFSIVLYDMDVENPNSSSPDYKHRYRIIREMPDTVVAEETEWHSVSNSYFQQHIEHMGMELAFKKDGVVKKETAPAGYNNYVGNEKYGRWSNRGGSSFWEFYGRYAFMSSMFNMMTYPARRSYWNDYRGNYYGSGRTYYGPSGQSIYGTKSYTSSTNGRNSSWANKSSDFKTNVRNNVSRSSSATKSRSYSSKNSYSKTSRSTSRSSSSTTYRSRSGGYGK